MRPGDLVVADQFAHASIVDGIDPVEGEVRYFRHNNAARSRAQAEGVQGQASSSSSRASTRWTATSANLPEIVEVCQRHGARIMIDEAHSTFLFGENGRGVAEHFGLEDEIDIHLGTFSKSLGGTGRLRRRLDQS